jgi:AcrR family transcriptional regulator
MSNPKLEGSARERLLAAATELFYAEGVHTVGIDRVIERAGVAKASLYSTFGSKDELVKAYLAHRAASRRRRVEERLARHEAPRDRILAIFDLLAETVALPAYRGCAFVNASAEGPRGASPVTDICRDTRGWLREVFIAETRALGAASPEALAGQLVLLYDGAAVGAAIDSNPHAAADARAAAESLLELHGESPAPRRRRVTARR